MFLYIDNETCWFSQSMHYVKNATSTVCSGQRISGDKRKDHNNLSLYTHPTRGTLRSLTCREQQYYMYSTYLEGELRKTLFLGSLRRR